MVGFLQSPTIEGAVKEEKEDIKTHSLSDFEKPPLPNDPLGLCIPELEDFSVSFSDSFLDFDSINGWLMEGNPGDPNMADLGGNPVDFDSVRGELGNSKEDFEVCGDGICKRDEVKEGLGGKEASFWGLGLEKEENGVVERSVEMGSEGVCEKVNEKGVLVGDGSSRNLGGLGCLIEEQLGKVSLEGASNCLVVASENDENVGGGLSGVNGGEVSGGGVGVPDTGDVAGVVRNRMKVDESVGDEGESSSASSSSSSSSSSSDEDSGEMSGEKKDKNEDGTLDEQTDVEDGEIMLSDADEMVAWGDDEDADDDGGGSRPIISKNELKLLPPVPSVNVTLEPHHETLPVGTILSIIGPQVIVEGVEKHNPLNEGSILWITESRSPLGIIDEIFGPVKNPYYIVRYNSETEVPPGIQQGTLISFVQEFADHVLNDKSLYQKGYDASGENDEELSDEIEFSDDEKEAEYKRTLKMKKRGTNESNPGNKRNEKRQLKNQKRNWKRNQDPAAQTPLGGDKLPVITEDQHFPPPVGASLNQDNHPRSGLGGDQAVVPPFLLGPQAPGFGAPNGIWSNGLPHLQQQGLNLPTGLSADGMLWMQQNLPYQLYQTPIQTNAAFQQQISTIPGLHLNFNALGGQPNFGGRPMLAPWTAGLDQNALNPLQFGMGLQGQHALLPLNGGGEQAVQSQGSQVGHNLQQSPASLNFNQGRGGGGRVGGGRRGNHRGRGRFGGGRGRQS